MFNKKLFLLILCSSLLVLIVGLTSELSLNDEVLNIDLTSILLKSVSA